MHVSHRLRLEPWAPKSGEVFRACKCVMLWLAWMMSACLLAEYVVVYRLLLGIQALASCGSVTSCFKGEQSALPAGPLKPHSRSEQFSVTLLLLSVRLHETSAASACCRQADIHAAVWQCLLNSTLCYLSPPPLS